MLKRWEELPDFMRTDEVRPYYEALKKKRLSLFFKRAVDLVGGYPHGNHRCDDKAGL